VVWPRACGRSETIIMSTKTHRPKEIVPSEHPLSPARLSVTYEPIARLKLNPRNPRLHSLKQMKQIANSIRTFGFNVPVLVDGAPNVIAGHGRHDVWEMVV
jgi:hypothetical protein